MISNLREDIKTEKLDLSNTCLLLLEVSIFFLGMLVFFNLPILQNEDIDAFFKKEYTDASWLGLMSALGTTYVIILSIVYFEKRRRK